jgi:hypothetical protein
LKEERTDERRQLKVIADEDKGLREAKGTKADGERDLTRLVDDAVVELAAREEGAEGQKKCQATVGRWLQ